MRLNSMYGVMSIERSVPPQTTRSDSPRRRESMAASSAARLLAHAASVVKFLPDRSKTLAMRPAATLDKAPGIESSVTGGTPDWYAAFVRLRMASCAAGAKPWKSGSSRKACSTWGQ